MIYKELLTAELNKKREDFSRFAEARQNTLADYLLILQKLGTMRDAEVREIVKDENVGALSSEELNDVRNVCKSFAPRWNSHEQARSWAKEILENRTTFAADGSQILFERELSMRVGAVQIGTFENPHKADVNYSKKAFFKLITPQDFDNAEREFDKPFNAETLIALERFKSEAEAVSIFLEAKKGWRKRGEKMPLAFFDGTLLISISMPRTSLQTKFVAQMVELVQLSQINEVPLVGYVDRSFARDLIGLLDKIAPRFNRLHEESETLHDAVLLNFGTLAFWGDCTTFFYCRRKGLSDFFNAENGSAVGFVYLQTTADNFPARLDIPAWIYEKGLLDEVLDTVRAECVVGLGYPYPLETADATAVISMRDREIFLRALQEFSLRENLNFRAASKKMSKGRRR